MKIRFEGTYKELQIVSSFFAHCNEIVVMETNWIDIKNDRTNYYVLDVDVIYDFQTDEESVYMNDLMIEQRAQECCGLPLPSFLFGCHEFSNILDIFNFGNDNSKEKIMDMIIESQKRIIDNRNELKKFFLDNDYFRLPVVKERNDEDED